MTSPTAPSVLPPTAHASFFATFDHRTLIITWSLYTILLVSIDKFDIAGAVVFSAFPLFAMIAGNVPPMRLIRRMIILSPFILIMAAANPFLDRAPVCTLAHTFTVTAGMQSAGVIVIKALLSLSSMLILEYCISINGLCEALRRLGVPQVFTTQLLLLHRYIHLIISEASTLMKARDMRSVGRRGKGPVDTANLIGTLLLRSAERSHRIYRSMLARGFGGTLPVAEQNDFHLRDVLFLSLSSALLVVLRFIL